MIKEENTSLILYSLEWKNELKIKKQEIKKYNTKASLDSNFDKAYFKIESSIFYSAFVIRKLIESDKLSDVVEKYSLKSIKYSPSKQINKLHKWAEENEYNWSSPVIENIQGKDLCSWIIHSYVFQLVFIEAAETISFYVSSDFDRNKVLHEVSISEMINYIDIVINDNIVEAHYKYNIDKKDYISIKRLAQHK
jgi:hypothetical protein